MNTHNNDNLLLEENAFILMTSELIQRFSEVGTQENTKNPLVVAKYFVPVGSVGWYAISYDPESNVCFGYVTGLGFNEFGYFSIDELEDTELISGIRVERDLYFEETPFKSLNL